MGLSAQDALGIHDTIEDQIDESGSGSVRDRLYATVGRSIELIVVSEDLAACEDFVMGLLNHCDLNERATLSRDSNVV
jgi:hypothetical protein